MLRSLRIALSVATVLLATMSPVAAQTVAAPPPGPPAPPPPLWTGSAGAGFSMNRGNTDTTNLNASFEATRDPKTKSVWKLKSLYLRGETDGALAVDRFLFDIRDERTLSQRVYAYGALQFLEDQFKAIDYLWAPNAGIGYKLIAAPMTSLSVDGGAGVKVEKNPDADRRTDAVITMSDKLEHKLSKTASITQGFGALWKADAFGDALYTFTAGVAAAVTTRTQIKLELLDSYASRPPTAEVKSNDVALLTAFVYKF